MADIYLPCSWINKYCQKKFTAISMKIPMFFFLYRKVMLKIMETRDPQHPKQPSTRKIKLESLQDQTSRQSKCEIKTARYRNKKIRRGVK